MKMMRFISAVIIVLLVSSGLALADGKMYYREVIPPKIPFQRALLMYDGKQETLLVQSRYQLNPSDTSSPLLGWVVPVPAVPELAGMEIADVFYLFRDMENSSRPRVLYFGGAVIVSGILFLLVFSFLGAFMIFFMLFDVVSMLSWLSENRRWIWRTFWVYLCLDAFVLLFFFSPNLSTRGGSSLVDVISEKTIGIYDVKVIRGKNSTDLIAWLKENSFRFDSSDTQVFDDYIKRNWCFVVAKVHSAQDAEQAKFYPEGLADPLILRFPVDQPDYPLALTATGGHDTLIHLYVISDKRATCDVKLPLWYAGEYFPPFDRLITEPAGFVSVADPNTAFLTVFKGTLTPKQMKKDALLTFTTKNSAYRKTLLRW